MKKPSTSRAKECVPVPVPVPVQDVRMCGLRGGWTEKPNRS